MPPITFQAPPAVVPARPVSPVQRPQSNRLFIATLVLIVSIPAAIIGLVATLAVRVVAIFSR